MGRWNPRRWFRPRKPKANGCDDEEPYRREVWQIPQKMSKTYGVVAVPLNFTNEIYPPRAPVSSIKKRYVTPTLTAYRLWPYLVSLEELRTGLNLHANTTPETLTSPSPPPPSSLPLPSPPSPPSPPPPPPPPQQSTTTNKRPGLTRSKTIRNGTSRRAPTSNLAGPSMIMSPVRKAPSPLQEFTIHTEPTLPSIRAEPNMDMSFMYEALLPSLRFANLTARQTSNCLTAPNMFMSPADDKEASLPPQKFTNPPAPQTTSIANRVVKRRPVPKDTRRCTCDYVFEGVNFAMERYQDPAYKSFSRGYWR